MTAKLVLVPVILLFSACGDDFGRGGSTGPDNQVITNTLPKGAYILPESKVADLLKQCSRATPDPGQGTWKPSEADIARLEQALPKALRNSDKGEEGIWSGTHRGMDPNKLSETHIRQYGGIVRDGHRYIYGNVALIDAFHDAADSKSHATVPVMVCDGGAAFFGVEFEPASGEFTSVEFNGSA